MDWGTGATLEQGLAQALRSAGVVSGTAHMVASVVVTVAGWFVW